MATTISSSKPILLVKHGNLLFEIWGDKQLAASAQTSASKSLILPAG